MNKFKVSFNAVKLEYSCELLRVLAHPLRLKILEFIDSQGTITVKKIYNALNIEQSVASSQLNILKFAGVLQSEKIGKFIHYKVNYGILHRVEGAIKNLTVKNNQ